MEIESWKIWTLIGGIPAAVSVVIGAVWLLTSKKIILSWTSKEDKKLEEIKGEIARNNTVLSNLINSQSNTYLFAHEKRLHAIEKFWEIYLKVKKGFPTAIYLMYTILTVDEIERVFTDFEHDTIPPLIRAFNAESYIKKLLEETEKIDKHRIYIEPRLWTIFFIYRAFCARLANWVGKGQSKGKIEMWTEEPQMKSLLKVIFSEEEIKKTYGTKINSLQFVFDQIELKILNEITELTTGTRQTKDYFNQISEYHKLVSEISNT